MPPSPSLEARRRSVPAACSSLLPSVALPTAGRHVWYAAIGSMTNPVSLLLRGIQPVAGCSTACVLRGYRLAFHGEAGMADIQRVDDRATSAPSSCSSSSEAAAVSNVRYSDHFHGVLHLISEAHLGVLDRIEASYRRIVVSVELYDGSTQAAYVYQMFDSPHLQRHGLPSERYIDIISRGCEHYNVCSDYIAWLRALPCVPRPEQSQLMALPLPAQCRLFTASELAMCDGEDGRQLCIAVNGKVLQYVGEPDAALPPACCQSSSPSSPSSPSFSAYHHLQSEFSGRDVTYLLSLMCYDPAFEVASCAAEMSDQHRRRVEDMYARKLACLASFSFEVVGRLVDEPLGAEEVPQSRQGVSGGLPTSPRCAAASGVLLDGRRIDAFKQRRRRGSLTSTLTSTIAQLFANMQTAQPASASTDSDSDGDDQCYLQQQQQQQEQQHQLPDAAAIGLLVSDRKSRTHSPGSEVSAASSTASTVVELSDCHDTDESHSPLRSPMSAFDDEQEEEEEDKEEADADEDEERDCVVECVAERYFL